MKNLIFIAILAISNSLFSQDISLTGLTWVRGILPSEEITNPGDDYTGTYNSLTNQTTISIKVKGKDKHKEFTLYVKRLDSGPTWPGDLNLNIARTSNGTDKKSIINGEINYFQTISTNGFGTKFFTFKGTFKDVNLQYQFTGISVLLPVDSYSTTILFTVMQL